MKYLFAFILALVGAATVSAAPPIVQPVNGTYWNASSKDLLTLHMLNERDVFGTILRQNKNAPDWVFFTTPLEGASLTELEQGQPVARATANLMRRSGTRDVAAGRATLSFVSGATVEVKVDNAAVLRFTLVRTGRLDGRVYHAVNGVFDATVVSGLPDTAGQRSRQIIQPVGARNLSGVARGRATYLFIVNANNPDPITANLVTNPQAQYPVLFWDEALQVGELATYRFDGASNTWVAEASGFSGRLYRHAEGLLLVGSHRTGSGTTPVVLLFTPG
jgi:hypothetical protein